MAGERTQLRRHPERGSHAPADVHAILDAAFLAHVGFCADGQPVVVPMLYGRDGEVLYLHGSSASRIVRALDRGCPACVTVTLVDGLVLARSAFNHSLNYRSVMAFGTAQTIAAAEAKQAALRVISDHLIAGRWAAVRPPSEKELRATGVVRFTIEEASAKVRTGPPKDDDADYALPVWAGVVPLRQTAAAPIADPRLPPGTPAPEHVQAYWRARKMEP